MKLFEKDNVDPIELRKEVRADSDVDLLPEY